MSAIAFDLPEDVLAVRDGVMRFVESDPALFEDQRQLYDETGRYSRMVRQLVREVRMLSSKAGFYNMCVPETLGGGGLGHLAYYVAWEAVNRRMGTHTTLTPWVISHWAFGPSAVLTQVTPEASRHCLAGMM